MIVLAGDIRFCTGGHFYLFCHYVKHYFLPGKESNSPLDKRDPEATDPQMEFYTVPKQYPRNKLHSGMLCLASYLYP